MSEHANDFAALRRRVRLVGRLRTVSGLRVGAGGSSQADSVDLPVLRDADGFPFIPGATVKGVIRSTVESLVRAVTPDDGVEPRTPGRIWACDPFSEHACGQHKPGERQAATDAAHCTACRLFGSRVVASHVRFTDLMCLDRQARPPIERRDGVAIDRDLGRVSGAQKYDFQVVAPGTGFALEIFADNLDDWELGLLMVAFDQLAEGFVGLGGFTSRGLGRVGIDWTAAVDFEPRRLLETGGELPESATADFEQKRDAWRQALSQHVQEML